MMSVVAAIATTRRTFDARPQLELDACDHAEETIAADGQPKQIGVLGPRTREHVAVGVNEIKSVDLIDDRFERQAAAMAIAGQRAADAQAIGASLLLINAPLVGVSVLFPFDCREQFRPLHPALDRDRSVLSVERDHLVPPARVDQHGGIGELLPAHRVPAAGDRDRLTGRRGSAMVCRTASTVRTVTIDATCVAFSCE